MSIFAELGVRDGKDRVKEEVLYNLAACYVLIEKKIAHVLKPHGLSPVKMNALLMVKHVGKKEGLSQIEISKRTIVTKGNITRLIDRLEKEKLVERLSKPGDARIKLIKITEKGSKLLDKVWPIYKKEVENTVSIMPAMDMITAGVVLSGFREALQKNLKENLNEKMS